MRGGPLTRQILQQMTYIHELYERASWREYNTYHDTCTISQPQLRQALVSERRIIHYSRRTAKVEACRANRRERSEARFVDTDTPITSHLVVI